MVLVFLYFYTHYIFIRSYWSLSQCICLALENWMLDWKNLLPIGQSTGENSWKSLEERLPGHSDVIAHYTRTRELLAYIEPTTPRGSTPRCSLQLTFSSPGSLQLEFFVSHPPPLTLPQRPNCHLRIYRCQRSQATRAATLPQRLHNWKNRRSWLDGIDCLDGLYFPIYLYS